jgi:hypothetical protein
MNPESGPVRMKTDAFEYPRLATLSSEQRDAVRAIYEEAFPAPQREPFRGSRAGGCRPVSSAARDARCGSGPGVCNRDSPPRGPLVVSRVLRGAGAVSRHGRRRPVVGCDGRAITRRSGATDHLPTRSFEALQTAGVPRPSNTAKARAQASSIRCRPDRSSWRSPTLNTRHHAWQRGQ